MQSNEAYQEIEKQAAVMAETLNAEYWAVSSKTGNNNNNN